MKILHCADLHIDSRMNTNFDAEKRKKRKAEILNTYRRMIEYAAEQGVAAILIAGVGGLTLTFGKVTITSVACALILGILVNVVVRRKDHPEGQEHEPQQVIK